MERASSVLRGRGEPVVEEATVFNHKGKLLAGLLVLLVAVGYFAFVSFRSATVYYYTVAEIKEKGPTVDGRAVRVAGKLVMDSFQREPDSTLALFSLTDGSEVLPASYHGVVPDLFFNEYSEIILEGYYRDGGVFDAQNVIVKCPSKYIAAQE